MVVCERKYFSAFVVSGAEIHSPCLKFPNDLDTRAGKNILFMRRIGDFTGQVLTGEVQILVQVQPPFRAIAHIVHNPLERDEFSCPALAVLAFPFKVRDEAVRDIHDWDYTGYPGRFPRDRKHIVNHDRLY